MEALIIVQVLPPADVCNRVAEQNSFRFAPNHVKIARFQGHSGSSQWRGDSRQARVFNIEKS
jgi:hypothetical protein